MSSFGSASAASNAAPSSSRVCSKCMASCSTRMGLCTSSPTVSSTAHGCWGSSRRARAISTERGPAIDTPLARPPREIARLTRLAALARAIGLVADLVVLEVAGELCCVLFLEQPLEAPPRRIARLLSTALGEIEILDDLVEIDVPVFDDRLIGLFVLEFV